MQRVIGLLQDVPAARVLLTGTLGAMEPLLVRCMHALQEGWHQVVVLQTKEEAAYFENDLRSMLPEGEGGNEGVVVLLPDSFKRAGVFEEVNTGNILLRTEVANKLIRKQGRGIVVVTYPEALFEQIVAPEQLSKTRIEISVGERLDVDFLIEVLISYHFERTDFVYKPGQFSIRGGIVDVFSYGNMLPYRVELFDDEVERICTFDVEDQLSKTRIRSVSILPNIQAHFRREEKRPLLDIMNRTTLVWCYDVQGVLDKLQYCMDKVAVVMEQEELMEVEELRALCAERAFVLPEQWIRLMEVRAIIEFGKVSYFGERATHVHFDCKPQPSFNKHFDLLIRNFHENTSAGMVNYLFSDNPRQLERFEHIFNDLKAGVTYCPVSIALHSGFIDYDLNIACYTDHQIFERYHKYNIRSGYNKADSLSLRMLRELQPGDYVTHIDHGVGVFSGLEKLNINGQIQETVRLIYRDKDLLYVGINSLHKISKYIGKEGETPKLNKIGSDAWDNLKRRTKSKIKDIAQELIKLYAKRRAATGFTFPPDTYLQNELEASFIYEDTPDQYKATNDVKLDMEKPYPMDRLICGDVGFGKTEVAIRAAFKAVVSGKQVAVLVPTTILALQHYRTFGERLKEFGVSIDYINRFKSTKQKNDIFERVKTGKLEILIGTHAILNQKINFQDLGLLIVDEEQKFGVAAKEKLRAMRVNVDTLTLTATPHTPHTPIFPNECPRPQHYQHPSTQPTTHTHRSTNLQRRTHPRCRLF
jgi:transcription-repair coupling factor (superfamily II helicase)